jgi:hypothetical protein
MGEGGHRPPDGDSTDPLPQCLLARSRVALAHCAHRRSTRSARASHASQVCQISRWEADFLQLLSFNTNVTVAQYASCCFALQRAYESVHSKPCRFFTYLMELHSPASNAPADD